MKSIWLRESGHNLYILSPSDLDLRYKCIIILNLYNQKVSLYSMYLHSYFSEDLMKTVSGDSLTIFNLIDFDLKGTDPNYNLKLGL